VKGVKGTRCIIKMLPKKEKKPLLAKFTNEED
jgi:hypothetical protein